MKRREFIKSGLIITAVADTSGHSVLREIIIPTEENVTQTEMERFIKEMDISMDRISHSGGDYLKNLISHTPSESEQTFFRSSLRSLLLIANFGELPIKGQVHPWMQKRLMYSAPEVNYSVHNSFDILRNMSDESKEEIRSAINDDPGLGDRILDALDLEAKSIGVPSARSRQMKVMGRRIIRRLSHSPEILINEYVKKTEKLLFAGNSEETLEKMFKMQLEEERYSAYSKEAESAAFQWNNSNIPDMPIGYRLMINDQDNNEDPNKTKKREPLQGLKALGVGVIITAVGWLIVAISGSMVGIVLGVTIGPIIILIALIIMLVSAIRRGKQQ